MTGTPPTWRKKSKGGEPMRLGVGPTPSSPRPVEVPIPSEYETNPLGSAHGQGRVSKPPTPGCRCQPPVVAQGPCDAACPLVCLFSSPVTLGLFFEHGRRHSRVRVCVCVRARVGAGVCWFCFQRTRSRRRRPCPSRQSTARALAPPRLQSNPCDPSQRWRRGCVACHNGQPPRSKTLPRHADPNATAGPKR